MPSYLAAGTSPLALEDMSLDREVEQTAEITAQAQTLGGAPAALDFVKNQFRLDWYAGSLKGSTETLRTRRGNDVDLSALLIALLRAQGTPARFVRGTIELPIARVAELMGFLTDAQVDALYSRTAGAPAFVLPVGLGDKVQQALTSVGIAYEPVTTSGQVSALHFVHTWVSAYLPYDDYRGTGNSGEGRQWVPLDPSIPGDAKYAATAPTVDAFGEMNLSASTVVSDYLGGPTALSPLAFLRAEIVAWLGSNRPGTTWESTLRNVVQRQESLRLIPGALPYKVIQVHDELPFVEDAQKHRLHVSVRDGTGTILEATLPLHRVLGHRSLLTSRPATELDALVISQAGGLYRAPASLVQVVPILKVDGAEQAFASRSVALGDNLDWTLELLLPDGSKRRIDNPLTAGNAVALGVGAPGNGFVEPTNTPGSDTDGPAARFLYGRAARYANAWTEGEEELARFLRVLPMRPTANVAMVENQLAVEEVLGLRSRVSFRGVEMDADLRTMVPIELVAGRGKELLRLSGHEGSFHEAKVLAEGTGVPAVSAVSVLQEAANRSVEVLRIDAANAGVQVPRLAATPSVVRDVQSLVGQGREVLIPIQGFSMQDWSGTGYIATNLATGEGGYFLSGIVSGGQTVLSPLSWTDQDLAEDLTDGTAPNAVEGEDQIARIVLVPSTNNQFATAGSPAQVPLRVIVTTASGTPVRNATVRFKKDPTDSLTQASIPLLSGAISTPFQDLTEIQLLTGPDGSARVLAKPDPIINHSAFEVSDSPYNRLEGMSRVTAETTNGTTTIRLASPFTLYTKAGAPHTLRLDNLDPTDKLGGIDVLPVVAGISVGAPMVTVTDAHGNAIANRSVLWSDNPAGGRFYSVEHGPGVDPPAIRIEGDTSQTATFSQQTKSNGTALVGYAHPETAGLFEVRAASGTLTATRTLLVIAPPADTIITVVRGPQLASYDGLTGTTLEAPYTARFFRRQTSPAPTWIQLTGREPDIHEARFYTKIFSPQEGLVRSESIRVGFENSNQMMQADVAGTVRIWPQFVSPDALQTMQVTADLYRTDGSRPCCNGVLSEQTYLSEASVVTPRRTNLEMGVQPVGACKIVRGSDTAIAFSIHNPTPHLIYARMEQQPRPTGGAILQVPPVGHPTRVPFDPSLYFVPPMATTTLEFPLLAPTLGGTVRMQVEAPTYFPLPVHNEKIGTPIELTVTASGDGGTGTISGTSELLARLVLPVVNFETGIAPTDGGMLTDPELGPHPLPSSALLPLCVTEPGTIAVRSGGDQIAAAHVGISPTGVVSVTPVNPNIPLPRVDGDQLVARVPPGTSPRQPVVTEFVPDSTLILQTETRELVTEIVSEGALPVGHTFVKNVSVVDGHLARQFEDLRVAGRAGGLALTRSYSNLGHNELPLGKGWSHNHVIIAYRSRPEDEAKETWMISGDGTGQSFLCGASVSNCKPQRGFHGTLRLDGNDAVFRSKGGTEYRFDLDKPLRDYTRGNMKLDAFPVTSVRDGAGRGLDYEYGSQAMLGQLVRVRENHTQRYLQFIYDPPLPGRSVRLSKLELREGLSSGTQVGTPLGVCVKYDYDVNGNLSSVRRYDGECPSGATALTTEPVRSELYAYDPSSLNLGKRQNNLVSYTDPNGNETKYRWVPDTTLVPGEGSFIYVLGKYERVDEVVEPHRPGVEAITKFEWNVTPSYESGVDVGPVFTTKVFGPRSDVPLPTEYQVRAYGNATFVRRPLDVGRPPAISSSVWDPVHVRPTEEVDPRGRRVKLAYDSAGSVIERRTFVGSLPGDGVALDTLAVDAGMGKEVVEKWSYENNFNQLECELDAEGRLTTHTIDLTAGLRLATRRYVNQVPLARVRGLETCRQIAADAGTTGADIVSQSFYCGVNSACSATAKTGDLERIVDGELDTTSFGAYDQNGNVLSTTVAAADLDTNFVSEMAWDARSRVEFESDSMGRLTETTWDALDRVASKTRYPGQTAQGLTSPPLVSTFSYFPAGQVHIETNGRGLVRETTLDGMNRPLVIEERDGGLATALTTKNEYDEAGNTVATIDRRGVRRTRKFDFADRLVRESVSIEPGANVDTGPVGIGGVVAKTEWDAAGNKVADIDHHGHRTEYRLDSLYRPTRTRSPRVPGVDGSLTNHETVRTYDLTGLVIEETDGNQHSTQMAYDFARRLIRRVDAIGRTEVRDYDKNGNLRLVEQRAGTTVQLRQSTPNYDGLNRPLDTTEEFALADGGYGTHVTRVKYVDSTHTVARQNARGFLTTTQLDGLDRPAVTIVDDQPGALPRLPDPAATDDGPLRLKTRLAWDATGSVEVEEDALGRQSHSPHDGLGRVLRRNLAMADVYETFEYDGEGLRTSHRDVRGVVRRQTYDALARPRVTTLVESLTFQPATDLVQREVSYADTPNPLNDVVATTEFDANRNETTHYQDGLHREVETKDAHGESVRTRWDAKLRRGVTDRKGYVTEMTYDEVDRLLTVTERDLTPPTRTFTQSTSYENAERRVHHFDRRGTELVTESDGLGRVTRVTRAANTLDMLVAPKIASMWR